MQIRDSKSIIIILVYAAVNGAIILLSLWQKPQDILEANKPGSLAPEYTVIENLDYFHLKENVPQLSLSAEQMRSQGEELAEFQRPRGVYNFQEKNKTIKYQALEALYKKAADLLTLEKEVKLNSEEAEYQADKVKYYFKKDLVLASGGVKFDGVDPKSKDMLHIQSDKMRANPNSQLSKFTGSVKGSMQRKKKYEGKTTFSSRELQLDGNQSLAHLDGDVVMKRESYLITAGKADFFLENYNKSLKYFVLNDDVKVTETLQTPEGVTERKAFSERLEGFGREQKMVLSGAPRVEYGKDVVKGYRITIRENVDLIEVDDAMSDLQMKRKKN